MKNSAAHLFLRPNKSIRDALAHINRNAGLAALVVDAEGRLLNVVTDGDIRRAILDGVVLEEPVSILESRKAPGASAPIVAVEGTPRSEMLRIMRAKKIQHLPLLDPGGRVVALVALADLVPDNLPQVQAVVMAGGFGKRLRPLTESLPKPMLPIGDRPLMEHTVEKLREAGISQVHVTTHFMPEKIREHFGDGQEFGVDISYYNEDVPLGTAGALSLLDSSSSPLLVINGDILTEVDFRALLTFHQDQKAELTMGVRRFDMQVPYGVVEAEGAVVRGISEKPTYQFFVNAGIYLLQPSACRLIPPNVKFDMTDLIELLIKNKKMVVSYPIIEYWLDIGRHDDYLRAQRDLEEGNKGEGRST